MAQLLTQSPAPLMTETLPAVKLVHFTNIPPAEAVYAYLRCYVLRDGFCFNLTQFKRAPQESDCLQFCIGPAEGDAWCCISCHAAGDAAVQLYHGNAPQATARAVPLRHFSGADEQGFYWSVEGTLTGEDCRALFGTAPTVGSVWVGNVFSRTANAAAFGSAFSVPAATPVPTQNGFCVFTVVPY